MEDKYFIAVYTNEVKDYCDESFFDNLFVLSRGETVFVIDNTIGFNYYNKLKFSFLQKQYTNFELYHLNIPEYPKESQFHRNVCDSVNSLRDRYLETCLPYFLIVESDVEPPVDLLDKFENTINYLDTSEPDWGIIGGLYYVGFHNYNFDTTLTSFERTHHCLSGCTLYKRKLIEHYQFRYNPKDLGPFPDAFICFDAGKEFSFWNDHNVRCSHLYNHLNGTRASKNL
jgi:hypothetical protein